MLWADDSVTGVGQIIRKTALARRNLATYYAKTISEDLENGYVMTVPDANMVDQWFNKEWYLQQHSVIKPNNPTK